MKNIINKIKKNKIFYVLLFFFLVMFPSAFYAKSEYQQRAILISVAVDKEEDDFLVNGLLVIASSAGNINSNVEVVSGKGKSVSSALNSIQSDLGKKVSLAHCDTIFVNNKILEEEDLSRVLDYFIRGVHATKNSLVIAVDGKGSELLNTLKDTKKINNFLASDLVDSENNLIGLTNVSLKEFFKDYFTPGQVSVMSVLKLESDSNSGGSSDSGSSGGSSGGSNEDSTSSPGSSAKGGGSSSGEESGKKEIKSEHDLIVLKKGRQTCKLTDKTSDVYNLLNDHAKTDFIYLDNLNVVDDKSVITGLGVEIVEKRINKKYDFEDDIPKLKYEIEIITKATEIVKEGEIENDTISSVKTHFNEGVKNEIKKYYNEGLGKLIQLSKDNHVDLFYFKDKLNKFHHKKWENYTNSLENEEDYLNNIEVTLDLKIKAKF